MSSYILRIFYFIFLNKINTLSTITVEESKITLNLDVDIQQKIHCLANSSVVIPL